MKYKIDKDKKIVVLELESKGDLFVISTIISAVNKMLISEVSNIEMPSIVRGAVNVVLNQINSQNLNPVSYYQIGEELLNSGNGKIVLEAGDGWKLVVKRL